MSVKLDVVQAAELLKKADNVLILTHKNPDGDTLGSGYALMYALHRLGKQACVVCHDLIPQRYSYFDTLHFQQNNVVDFVPQYIVAVDLADTSLLGESLQQYAERVDLCIDHHISNREYAKNLLLSENAAATCELMFDVIEAMQVEIDKQIAECLYTGLVTDTGCFRYPSVTVYTHHVAERLMQAGADTRHIHHVLYENVRREKISLMLAALQSLRYELDGRCAIITLMRDTIQNCGVTEGEPDGLSTIPRDIEGVLVGVTIRQLKNKQGYKISVRTEGTVNASKICHRLGGGGHIAAAGCTISGLPLQEVCSRVLCSVREELDSSELCTLQGEFGTPKK